jgi:hypothetical protein
MVPPGVTPGGTSFLVAGGPEIGGLGERHRREQRVKTIRGARVSHNGNVGKPEKTRKNNDFSGYQHWWKTSPLTATHGVGMMDAPQDIGCAAPRLPDEL